MNINVAQQPVIKHCADCAKFKRRNIKSTAAMV